MTGMTEDELMEVWNEGSARGTWLKVRKSALAENDSPRQAMADERLAELPSPLQSLAANVELVRRLIGARWIEIMHALEGGATWVEVAAALEVSVDEARGSYTAAIEAQERYVGDLHDAPRARAVLADDQADGSERR